MLCLNFGILSKIRILIMDYKIGVEMLNYETSLFKILLYSYLIDLMSLVFGFVGNQDCLKFGMRLKIVITLSAKHSVPWNKTWNHLSFPLSIEHRIENVTLTLDANYLCSLF